MCGCRCTCEDQVNCKCCSSEAAHLAAVFLRKDLSPDLGLTHQAPLVSQKLHRSTRDGTYVYAAMPGLLQLLKSNAGPKA